MASKAKEVYTDKLNSFKDRIQKEAPAIPLQKVVRSKGKGEVKEPEEQVGLKLPKSLNKKLKMFAVVNEMSIKDVIANALLEYMENHKGK